MCAPCEPADDIVYLRSGYDVHRTSHRNIVFEFSTAGSSNKKKEDKEVSFEVS